MQIGMGFMASRTLLAAVELRVSSVLASGRMTRQQLEKAIGLHSRSSADFLDALVAMKLLQREDLDGFYSNAADAGVFLDEASPSYIGGVLNVASRRLYRHWSNLTDGLLTGEIQNEGKSGGKNEFFSELYSSPVETERFMAAMTRVQKGNFAALANKFDFSKHHSMCDIGGCSGLLAMTVAKQHPNVECATVDLPAVSTIASRLVSEAGFAERVKVVAGDFMVDPFPAANVICMGNILHDWGLERKKFLLKKAFDSLPPGGVFIAIENVIDDERKTNIMGLLMSLNMLIETSEGFDYTGSQFKEWAHEAGFSRVEIMPLAGYTSAAVAYKSASGAESGSADARRAGGPL